MSLFKKTIVILNKIKYLDLWGDRNEGLSSDDIEHINSFKKQNPYGIVGMIMAGFVWLFPQYGLSVFTLIFCVITFFTFDKEKEDNPWPFIIGIIFSFIGLYMFITGQIHRLII